MTNDVYELRVHAERLSGRDLGHYQGPTGDDADMRAGIALARAWLAEHPADEDTPIDSGWLKEIGFYGYPNGTDLKIGNYPKGNCLSRMIGERDKYTIWAVNSGWLADGAEPRTRGDLRRLCAALGIELKEGK
jgi:hypothetical protein